MKPKFILATSMLLIISMLIISCKHKSHINDDAVKQFLAKFNGAVTSGNVDFIKTYFVEKDAKINRLAQMLAGKTDVEGNSPTIFKLDLVVDESKTSPADNEAIDVSVPVLFSHNNIETGNSVIKLKLIVNKDSNMRISAVNVSKFLPDYIAYENLVKSKTLTDKDIYAPITLKAFETAKQLKTKYDSVIWFEHINKQTYYYVTNGKWNMGEWEMRSSHLDTAKTYKMGLVGPNLKEIIPVDYDLIHNINGTINGLIEVEKAHKHGFYNLKGKVIVPVEYDQIYPVTNDKALAAMQKGSDFYWLNKDSTISNKIDISISQVLAQTSHLGSFNQDGNSTDNVTEFNARTLHGSIYIPPAYLVNLGIFSSIEQFKNPLRKNVEFEEVSNKINIKLSNKLTIQKDDNIFETAFYSIRNYFLGGRSEFYDTKRVVVIDKKRNQIYSNDINVDYTESEGSAETNCTEYAMKGLNDSLFEIKISAAMEISLPGSEHKEFLNGAPVYHYLYFRNNKLIEQKCNRLFSFTKYVKMDDSYLQGCYEYTNQQTDYLKPEYLRYVKNEIYADYNYKFKDTTWNETFSETMFDNYKPVNISVDDSLTDIDKYNINWINQKLKATESKKLASR